MSYNCDDVTCLSIDAWMSSADVRRLYREHQKALPECCFLADLYEKLPDDAGVRDPKFLAVVDELKKHDPKKAAALASPDATDRVKLDKLTWQGTGSGYSFELLTGPIAAAIHGRIEAVLIWEGGDSTTGLLIEDGKATEMDVEQKLVPKRTHE